MRLQREEVADGFEREADLVRRAGGVVEANEYGTPVSVHVCATCGQRFTVCPPSTTYGTDCLSTACASYDPARDADIFFAPDDPDLIETNR